jgi:hypothetical protein
MNSQKRKQSNNTSNPVPKRGKSALVSVKATTSNGFNGTSDKPNEGSCSSKSIYDQSATQLHDLLISHGVPETICKALMGS